MWQYNHLQPNELMHYGRKGMKWGRRTYRSQTTDGGKKRITETKLPLYGTTTVTKIKNKDGSKSINKLTEMKRNTYESGRIKNKDGSVEKTNKTNTVFGNHTSSSTFSKKQINAGRAAVVGIIALNGAVAIANLKLQS